MLFPEDIWKIVKEYLLVSIDGILFKRISSFEQAKSLELQYHLFYRLLKTQRMTILEKMIDFVSMVEETWKDVEVCISDDDYENDVKLITTNQQIVMDCIQVRKVMNKFLDIYETAPIKTLLEILYTINGYEYFEKNCDFITQHYESLCYRRRKTDKGMIDYIWETTEYDEIQYFFRNPLLRFEKEGRTFVAACSNRGASPFKRSCSALTAKRKGITFAGSSPSSPQFNKMLDFLDFPFANYNMSRVLNTEIF